MAESSHGTPAFAPGARIGPYRVVKPLGKGGMAEVYEVENERLGSRFALKAFTLDHGDVEFLAKRFRVEGRLLARLSHPRVVRVYDMDVDAATGIAFYVMDLVLDPQGRPCSLKDAMASGEADEDQVANWYEDLREGLAYIHGQGIVHRDLTLENVLIGSDGRAVLTDFGVSKILPRDLRAELEQTMTTLVRDGKPVMGKPFYLAPELARGADESPASDYYSVGVMLLRLLTQVWYTPGAKLADLLAPFDAKWGRILPELLADDPAARRCPPWRERANPLRVVTAENKTNEVTLRIRFPHWLIGCVLLATMGALLLAVLLAVYEHGRRQAAEREVRRLSSLLERRVK